MHSYLGVLIYLVISAAITFLIYFLNWRVAPRLIDSQKATAYECGFDPFGAARSPFEIRFYLVAILFLVFDLEVAYLFPWALSFLELGVTGFWVMALFLFILVIGFLYEWFKGALDWN
uniref:NADH-ubiquinone oxidoreductase chain 3 n=1 Tax=Jenufa perforata TaxID=993091 RepID=A0A6G7IU79_9CHLO|nr:NADH dehydrogenase subunit 3 [Jenufa perforata]QII41626.1 NADH dehydrogenase subunit 3 [Jenufa perforata]